ncbi:receptor-type tyrosine-protein phosphatase F-like isoform X2 [Macrobrachium rosenbergii]|uniref:receptor-type tyrosine-protein phosphatase F-like isoform X2 n=1 Tax=Macrobrachium rosenbergii TaxID=79674 RepID=UPI0034D3EC30
MSFKLKDIFFLLGILWATTLPPGTTASLSQDHTGNLHHVLYGMSEGPPSIKDLHCFGTEVLMPPGKREKARGLTCTGENNVSVPIYSRQCVLLPKKLTITVNSDEDVIVEFRENPPKNEVKWQKEPLSRDTQGEISNLTGDRKLILPRDKSKESGFYSFKINDTNPSPKHGMYCTVAVFRRGCPANKHGDKCQTWCPDCMYGGICHDKTGTCICPPGRKGTLCEEACLSEETGNSCSIKPPVEMKLQVCLPFPYGCSCLPGWKGYDCSQGCDENQWGVNCLQTCNHCESSKCDKVTGVCEGQMKPCAGKSKGYYRFRELPEVQADKYYAKVSFSSENFDGEMPESDDLQYRVIVWEKDQDMSKSTTFEDVARTETTFTIKNLKPATDYYAAVLANFTLKNPNTSCLIDGTLRGERIQKTPFTTKCPKGRKVNITVNGISSDGFNISWNEEAYARKCNFTYRLRIKETSKEEIFNDEVETTFHVQKGLNTYTEHTVMVLTGSDEGYSSPVIVTIQTLPKIPDPPEAKHKESRDSVMFYWERPLGAQGKIKYSYSYEVKPFACDQKTDIWLRNSTEKTFVSFPKPLHYANVTFRLAIGNEAGFSGEKEYIMTSNSKVPEIEVREIRCEKSAQPRYCLVTLEDNCNKVNGKDLDIDAVLEYTSNSAKNPRTGNQSTGVHGTVNNRYEFNVTFPEELYNHTSYRLEVFVKNDEGRSNASMPSSYNFSTPAVAPGVVTILNVLSAHSSISVAWDPPPSWPPTGDIEKYCIDVYKSGKPTSKQQFCTEEEFYSISGLDPEVSYTIKVFGINRNVTEPGVPAEKEVKTVAQKPSPPLNIQENSSLEEVFITWDDHQDDKKFALHYKLAFQHETYNTSKKEYNFTGLQAETSYPLKIKSCNEWKCSDDQCKIISTKPRYPEIEGQVEVLEYSGNVSKMRLPRVKNPPAVQYVVVVETAEDLDDARIKELSVQKVEDYIEEHRDSNLRVLKRSTTQLDEETDEPKAWVSGIYQITNTTTKDVEVGTGVGEDQALEEDKDYQLVAVTEKKSGRHREFAASDPVNAKGVAIASGLSGILFGVLIFLVLIGLFVWTYKKRQSKVVVRTSNQDKDCFLPVKNGTLQKKPSLCRKLDVIPNLVVEEAPQAPQVSPGILEEDTYTNLSRRIPFVNIEAYLLKAIHSNETDLEFNSVPKVLEKSCSHSEHPENRLKNRYKNNLPYNDTRIRLPRLPQMPFSDYINANYIEGHLHPNAYIATQGPKDFNKDTTHDFWRMIWHTKSQLVIMIANLVENGKVKVAQYWPSEGTITRGGIDITLVSTELKVNFIIRTFAATDQTEVRKIQQYQYTTWPDHDIPENPYGVAQMINSIRSEPLAGPVVVHCSAGIGRTGTILFVLGVLDQINKSGYMDTYEVLVKLRNGRPGLIENTTQYKFAHDVLREILCGQRSRFSCREFPEALLDLRTPQSQTNISILQQQFHEIKQLPKDFTFKFAQRPEVSHLNRNPKILPPDSRMIFLQYASGREESQYINAALVKSLEAQVIVAEHPQTHTLCRVWQMVYEKRVSVWTLLHSFPPGDSEYPSVLPKHNEEIFGEFAVKIMSCQFYDSFTEYEVTIRPTNSATTTPFNCMVVMMKLWPHDTTQLSSLLPLLAVMERVDSLTTTSSAALFTCKDGVTGCGLMMALKHTIDRVKLHQEVDVYHSVQSITFDRPEFIVSEEQYDLVHEGVLLYLSAYSNYGNFN